MDIGGGGGNSWNDRQQLEGRRKVEFGVTADKMYYCRCNVPLHLHYTLHKHTIGIGGYLLIL